MITQARWLKEETQRGRIPFLRKELFICKKKKKRKKWTFCIQRCFVPILVESGSVVFEKNLKSPYYYYLSLERELSFIWINFCRIFVFPYSNYLPVTKSNALHFNKMKFYLLKMLCAKLVEISPLILEKKSENVKKKKK